MKAYAGIDPGKYGALALIIEDGTVLVHDWSDELTMFQILTVWVSLWDVKLIVLEKLHKRENDSARSATTFQQHIGSWICICKLLEGLHGVNWRLARPDQWQKGRIKVKSSRNDKPSVPYVSQRYPEVSIRGPRGGLKDGRSDAICMAEYGMELCTGKRSCQPRPSGLQ